MNKPYLTAPVSAQTIEAHIDWADASRAASGVKRLDPGYYTAQARLGLASVALEAARNSDRAAFERARGWKFCKWFSLRQLKVGSPRRKFGERFDGCLEIDHSEYLRFGRRPIAILSHSYATWETLQAFAEKHGLDVEPLSASWYYPSGTQAVVFTVRRSEVQS
jgi:hypothetical protein